MEKINRLLDPNDLGDGQMFDTFEDAIAYSKKATMLDQSRAEKVSDNRSKDEENERCSIS